MNSFSCPLPNSAIKELTDKIISKYPDASKRSNFTIDQCCEWIGAYNNANNKNLDFIPDMNSLVSFVEKKRNTDGKSFLSVPYSITYNLPGQKTQTYTIIGSKIFNKDGKEVFTADLEQNKTHRNKIFANLAVQQKRAVVVEHNNNKYVVNNKNQIISVATGKMMQWGEENGDRKAILLLAKDKFSDNQSSPKYYEGNITPDTNTIFVFGSNPKGIHGAGAARTAEMQFGAQRGVGEGLTGSAYALPTKDLDKAKGTRWYRPGKKEEAEVKEWYKTHSITEVKNHPLNSERTISPSSIIESIKKLYEVARQNPTKQFKVSNYPIGQLSLNGYLGEEMIQMFKDAGSIPSNVIFSKEWIDTGIFNTSSSTSKKDLSDFEFYSGAAQGSDTEWANQAKSLGIKVKDYTVNDWDKLNAEKKSIFEKEYQESTAFLGRFVVSENSYGGKLVRRDMMQADSADAIFAVATVIKPGEYDGKYPNKTNHDNVSGGTGYACARGIQRGIPVYLFDQKDNIWKVWKDNKFIPTEEPTLTPHAATIGTRGIQENGKQAIRSILSKISQSSISDNSLTPQLIDHLKSMGINVLGRAEMEEFLKKNNINTLQQAVTFFDKNHPYNNELKASEEERVEILSFIKNAKYNNAGTSVVILDNNDTIFLIDHSSDKTLHENLKENEEKDIVTDCFGIRSTFNRDELNADIIRYIIRNIARGSNPSEKSVYRILSNYGLIGGQLSGINIAAELKMVHDYDAGLLSPVQKAEYNALINRYSTDGRENSRSSGHKEETQSSSIIEYVKTTQGEVYGFVDKDGNIYLDETIISPEHPIHEYTHLWDRTIAKNNPRLWNRGITLMQKLSLWNEIANDANYGKVWESKGISGERLTNLIASEVHSRLTGKEGKKILDTIAKQKEMKRIVESLKQWINNMWSELKSTFGTWTNQDLDNISIDDFINMPIRDLAEGINPNNISLSPSSTTSDINTNNLAESSVLFELTDAEIKQAQAQISKKAEEEKVTNLPKPKSEAYESAFKQDDSRIAQFHRTFSPQQLKDRGVMISDIFSQLIDIALGDAITAQEEIINNDDSTDEQKNEAKKRLNELRDPVNGRQLITKNQIPEFITAIKKRLEYNLSIAEEDKKVLWENTIEFFEELFNTQASLDIEEREGIRIVDLKVQEVTSIEDSNNESNSDDAEEKTTASATDGWGFKIRYTNPQDALSKRVRSMLYDIEKSESEKDDLGHIRKYPMGQIYASLISFLSKAVNSADDFVIIDKSYTGQDIYGLDITEEVYPNGYPTFPALEKMKNMYPWAEQLIARLTDDYISPELNDNLRYPSTGGSMTSQLYTNIRTFIPYAKIQIGENKFGVTPLNYQMEDRVQYDKFVANYDNRNILSKHSIYNSDGTINKENAEYLNSKISELLGNNSERVKNAYEHIKLVEQSSDDYKGYDESDTKEFNNWINEVIDVFKSFGIEATEESVLIYLNIKDNGNELSNMFGSMLYASETAKNILDENIPEFNYILDLKDPYGSSLWSHFFDNRGFITDTNYIQSYYDTATKKSKYSYSADNYLMRTFRGVCMGTQAERQAFIEKQFGNKEWFRNQDTKEWRNKWLEYWYNKEDDQTTIPYTNIDNITEYIRNDFGDVTDTKTRSYTDWTPTDIFDVQLRSYGDKKDYAYYLAPIFSDSPMSMTVMGPKLDIDKLLYGYTDDNKIHHQGALVSLVNQELWRINYVRERKKSIEKGIVNPISNFDDGRGAKFCFIPELNSYVFSDTGRSFIEEMEALSKDINNTSKEIEARQIEAITDIVSAKLSDYNAYSFRESGNPEKSVELEQYLNMVYANASIIQLTTIDLAFYKNDTDFQKRFKEVYAGGIKLNTNSKYGKKTENVITICDDVIVSRNYDTIAKEIDSHDALTKEQKERIKGVFKEVNVADAQAIRSMYSFRSVLDMMGNWTDAQENALKHFEEGTWSAEDFDIMYQVIKPFMYTVVDVNDGNGSVIAVPLQHKNSEICALMMYDLISNSLGNSEVYKALSEFMNTTKDSKGNHLIDMSQFESAGKVGNQGVIDVSFSPVKVIDILNGDSGLEEKLENKECLDNLHPAYDEKSNATLFNDEENARENLYGKDGIKNQLIKLLDAKKISQKDFNTIMSYFRPNKDEIISMLKKATLNDKGNDINPEVVSTVPFENYYQAQPTPAHHIDSEAPFGSQGRNIAIADLPEDIEIEVPCYEQGNKDASHTLKGSDSIIDFVFELLNENLIEDFFGKGSNKGLKGIFKSKESLRDAVKDIVRGNPKYGRDFVEALQLDSENNFRLSINSPTMFHLMEDIITSFFKNHITKQKINGAALIQAAGIGLDDELQLKYDDNGKLLGAECYMPITSKKFFEPFLDDTVINGKKVKVLNIENLKKAGLDKAVGYRIPTENTSSMMPLIIKGFTPLQNGSVIVLPAEITALAGSDFDVDKMFLMLLEYGVRNYNIKKALRDFNHSQDYWSSAIDLMFNKDNINEDDYEDSITDEKFDKEAFKEWFDKNKENYRLSTPEFYQIKYNFNISPKENGRKARNNMIIQMYHKLLSSKKNYASIFNPQGFDDVKRAAKITRIITDTNLITTLFNNYNSSNLVIPSPDSMREFILESARNKGISGSEYTKYEKTINECSDEELRDAYIKKMFVDNSGEAIKWLLDSNTKTKEFIDFINSNSFNESPIFPQTFQHSHAKNMAGSNQLGIYAVQGSMCAKFQRAKVELKPEHSYTINGREITNIDFSDDGKRLKNVGQLIGASADNGKDPNLSDMGSTKKTAPIIGMLLRSGLSHLEAALIANQPIMNEVHYNPDSLSWNRYLDKNKKKRLFKTFVPVTTELLIKGIIDPYSLTYEEETSINCICYKALLQNKAQESLTRISRADSPNGAIGNSYAKARIQKYNVDYFQELQRQDDNFPYKFIDDALSNDAVDVSASEESVREQLKKKKMGLLHGMYALGINSFNSLMSDYFFGATEHFDNTFVKPILYNISTAISDETKEEAINSLYTSYITYVLSGCPLFGNETKSDGTIVTMKEKRDYYLNTFPNEFRKILSENKDIRDLLGNILTVSGKGKNSRIVLKDVGSISKELKKEVQLRFEKLGYLDNNVARDLIKDLFIYSYYDNGLQFTHDSFSSLFTSSFLLNVPVFNETLQKLDNPLSEEEETNFLNQFVLTCNKFIIPLKDNVFPKEAVSDDGEVITIDFNDKDRKFIYRNEFINHTFDSNKPIPFIRYNDSIYAFNTNAFKANGGVAEYNRLSNYPTSPNRPLFSIQMSVNQMANTFNVAEESDKNNIKEEKPSSSQQAETPYEVPKTPNEASRDMSDYVAREASKMEDYDVPNFFIDSTEKNYTSEGENELQKPICNE